jgi:hypothetical protein
VLVRGAGRRKAQVEAKVEVETESSLVDGLVSPTEVPGPQIAVACARHPGNPGRAAGETDAGRLMITDCLLLIAECETQITEQRPTADTRVDTRIGFAELTGRPTDADGNRLTCLVSSVSMRA